MQSSKVILNCFIYMSEDVDKVELVRKVNIADAGVAQNIADVCKTIDVKRLYLRTDYVFA